MQNRLTDYLLVYKSLTVFGTWLPITSFDDLGLTLSCPSFPAALCFAALAITIAVALRCRMNFDRGLRYHRESDCWTVSSRSWLNRFYGPNEKKVMKDTPTRTTAARELRHDGDDESEYGFESSYKMSSSANLNRMSID